MISASERIPDSRGGSRRGSGRKPDAEREVGDYARYNAARAKREEHNAEIAEMEARRMAGDLIDVAAAAAVNRRIASNIRARLLALPKKCAPIVLGVGVLTEIEEALTSAVHECLRELAGYVGDE